MFFSCSIMSFQQTISGSGPIQFTCCIQLSCLFSFFFAFGEFLSSLTIIALLISYNLLILSLTLMFILSEVGPQEPLWSGLCYFDRSSSLSENFHIFWLKIFLRLILLPSISPEITYFSVSHFFLRRMILGTKSGH